MDAMGDLVRAGKIRYYGMSNSTGQLISESQLRAKIKNIVPPHSEQSSYSIFDRFPERELLGACHKYNVAFFAYSPLDGGWLTGKYRKGQTAEKTARQRLQPGRFDTESAANEKKLDQVEALYGLARETGIELSHMAIGFVLAHRAVSCALIGGSKVEHIQKHLEGQDVILSDEILDKIDGIASPGTGGPIFDSIARNLTNKDLRRRRREIQDNTAAQALERHIRGLVDEHNKK
jgi:aryl-alcohol dehydrogenase-like predicted oxidoreductase